jgi:aminoglycoside 2''-phosphotransferase
MVGDPAVDLAALPWTPEAFYKGLFGAYPITADAAGRVCFYCGTFALQEALFGLEQGGEGALRRGIAAYV